MTALLAVEDLEVRFRRRTLADLLAGRDHDVHAVNGVSLALDRGETLGLVGESGCGKSTFGRAVLRLIAPTGGQVRFAGEDVGALSGERLLAFRRRAQMIFQDPFASLNPRFTVAETLAEVLRVHRLCAPAEVAARVAEAMAMVGLSADLGGRRPGALSGGQCQRAGIARALALAPDLVIADEALSALDVSIQAQVLNLLEALQRRLGLAMIFISHDLGVVRHLCRRIAVMYLGRIVESGPAAEVFETPRHPYTRALVAAIPRMDADAGLPAETLAGEPPSASRIPAGCPFHPRCPRAFAACREGPPPSLRPVGPTRVACHLY